MNYKPSLIICLFLLLFSTTAKTQIINLVIFPHPTTGCNVQLELYGESLLMDECQFEITGDWGDGDSGTMTITSAGGLVAYFEHYYSQQGTYTASFSVLNLCDSTTVGPETIVYNMLNPPYCSYAVIPTMNISTMVQTFDIPLDFTDVNGVVSTIVPAFMNGTYAYSGLNQGAVPYSVSINDNWLSQNGYEQVSPDISFTSFDAFGNAETNAQSLNFQCTGVATDPNFAVSAWPGGFVAPLQQGILNVNVCNTACGDTSDVTVSVTFPAGFVPDTTGLINPQVNGTTLTFDLQGVSNCQTMVIPFFFPGATPAGTQICFFTEVTHPDDTDPTNNNDSICTVVQNSYDPNEKISNQPTYIDPSAAEMFQYIVHFQNDGNMNALQVIVRDTVDPSLDLSTFRVIASKHPVSTMVDPATREVKFTFSNIQLTPSSQDMDSSQGYVVYEIAEHAGLPAETAIENTAFIYFDFNPPIVTNTTYSINHVLGLNEQVVKPVFLSPNPATTTVRCNGALALSAQVYDLAGKLVIDAYNMNNNEFSVAGLANGVYQVVIVTVDGVQTEKLVINR
jgi:uncharacterized repeat protein (TIGR01451 family)